MNTTLFPNTVALHVQLDDYHPATAVCLEQHVNHIFVMQDGVTQAVMLQGSCSG